MIHVQFADQTSAVIVAVFAGRQPEETLNQGTVEASDVRWKVFYEGLPTDVQSTLPVPAA